MDHTKLIREVYNNLIGTRVFINDLGPISIGFNAAGNGNTNWSGGQITVTREGTLGHPVLKDMALEYNYYWCPFIFPTSVPPAPATQ